MDCAATYSAIGDGDPGTGNICCDPIYCIPEYPNTAPVYFDFPGFFAVGFDDYRLAAGSPCIDAGDNRAVPADTADLDGDGDTTERTPLDLDENGRFVNDPATPNTGVPDPPDYVDFVDMGAYEYDPSIVLPPHVGNTIYVDDDAPNDPGPGDPGVSDPNEDGSLFHPFDTIQEGLNVAISGDEVVVAQGTYQELINFNAVSCTLRSTKPIDPDVVDATIITWDSEQWKPDTVVFDRGENGYSVISGFTIRNTGFGNAVYCSYASPTISYCDIGSGGLLAQGGKSQVINGRGEISNPGGAGISWAGRVGMSAGGVALSEYDVMDCDPLGASLDGRNTIVTGCKFIRNHEGGLYLGNYNDPDSRHVVRYCVIEETFRRNAEIAGNGLVFRNGEGTVENCPSISSNEGTGILACGPLNVLNNDPDIGSHISHNISYNATEEKGRESSGRISAQSHDNCPVYPMLTDGTGIYAVGPAEVHNCIVQYNDGYGIVGPDCAEERNAYSCLVTDNDHWGIYQFHSASGCDVHDNGPDGTANICLCPVLAGAGSRMYHGEQWFYVWSPPDPPAGAGIECREGGPTSVVLTFSCAVAATDEMEVSLSAGSLESVSLPPEGGHEMTIGMSDVPDQSCLGITVNGLVSADDWLYGCGGVVDADTDVHITVLCGDVDGNGIVDGTDRGIVLGQIGHPVDESNFRCDLNSDGNIAMNDVAIVDGAMGNWASCP